MKIHFRFISVGVYRRRLAISSIFVPHQRRKWKILTGISRHSRRFLISPLSVYFSLLTLTIRCRTLRQVEVYLIKLWGKIIRLRQRQKSKSFSVFPRRRRRSKRIGAVKELKRRSCPSDDDKVWFGELRCSLSAAAQLKFLFISIKRRKNAKQKHSE